MISNLYRIIIYEISFITFLWTFYFITDYKTFDKNSTLNLLISVVAIIVAIIITFLFSKLFSEKSIRVERKKEIDSLSIKITYLRRIAFHIRSIHEFWEIGNTNSKSVIDYKYKKLTYEEYRGGRDGRKEWDYEDWKRIDKEISSTIGQSYLALKGLEDGQSEFSFFSEFNPQNYSLNDIARYKEYTGSFWSFLDRSDSENVNFDKISDYEKNFIDELFFKIVGRQINKKEYKQEIKDLLTNFDSVIFEKHYYLNNINSDNYPITFRDSFNNMLIFIIILLASVVLFVSNFNQIKAYLFSLIILCFFISNTIDLILITMKSIKFELKIDDIYKI